MRRKRRNRATWFPILGFDLQNSGSVGLSTVDVREITVQTTGAPNVIIIPIIPDIDIPPETSQTLSGQVVTPLRAFVEGQSCLIERIVGKIQVGVRTNTNPGALSDIHFAAALAVVPTEDDGTGNPAVDAFELDPLRANNSHQPWLWRRTWSLSNPAGTATLPAFPQNNALGSAPEGSFIDTKGTKRMIRREERIFLIYSVVPLFTDAASTVQVVCTADLRVIGTMVKAHNKSHFA